MPVSVSVAASGVFRTRLFNLRDVLGISAAFDALAEGAVDTDGEVLWAGLALGSACESTMLRRLPTDGRLARVLSVAASLGGGVTIAAGGVERPAVAFGEGAVVVS